MQAMGGMGGLMGMMPGVAKMKNQIATAGLDDKLLKRQVAIIDSMTPQERRNPDILKASRKKRIAAGSGTTPEAINKLLKMHRGMADMMKAMGSGKRGPLAGLGADAWASARAACRRRSRWPSSPRKCRAARCRRTCRAVAAAGHAELAAEFPRATFPDLPGSRRRKVSRHCRASARRRKEEMSSTYLVSQRKEN